MKAISVRAPWWWFILHAGKDIENRDWPTHFRGTVLVHSSKWWNLNEVRDDSEDAIQCYNAAKRPIANKEFTYRELRDVGGHIVGKVDIVDCVSASDSPWFFGKYGFVLANPVAFSAPVAFKGALGLFEVPDSVFAEPKCRICEGIGTVDSGGIHPWGEAIFTACSACDGTGKERAA